MTPAISVENLGKCYRINHAAKRGGYKTLRESLGHAGASVVQRLRGMKDPERVEDFWALKDVSFEVQPGEVVGIIGRNGAGKSTLLKILSQITKPTMGAAWLLGRVGSLLEVGTGFHPELTGRENIFLNGAILGMTRQEIVRKFDDIVSFAGIESFLDTPVKRYSSGMYVRLGFAVASHLDLEILVVDEVLAVGDVAFQKKCLGKMKDVTQSGRTVLFVSHNMAAVRNLCHRGILLEGGRIRHIGDINSTTELYLESQLQSEDGVEAGRLPCVTPANDLALSAASLTSDDTHLELHLTLEAYRRFALLGVGFAIRTLDGTVVVSQGPLINGVQLYDLTGTANVTVTIRDALQLLNGGTYLLDLWVGYPGIEIILKLDSLIRFEVPEQDPYGCGRTLSQRDHGPCCLLTTFADHRIETSVELPESSVNGN